MNCFFSGKLAIDTLLVLFHLQVTVQSPKKRKEFLHVWCSWSFELGLCLLNALLAVPQCPLVIAAPVISSLLTVFRGLVAVSAYIDLLCQGNIYQSPSVLYSTFHWPCMRAVM